MIDEFESGVSSEGCLAVSNTFIFTEHTSCVLRGAYPEERYVHLRRNGMSKTIAFGIRLEPIIVELVRKIATQRGISASAYIREAIHQKLLKDFSDKEIEER